MQATGGTLVKHYKSLAFMGFLEVFLNLRTIFKNIIFCKNDITTFAPDTIIFIDYPGFNMRIAKWAKQNGIKTQYYISPQIWAWKENRINDIKRDFDALYVILPFEKEFYEQKHNFPVHFVGHPLIDAISQGNYKNAIDFRRKNQLSDKPIIAILPGSRKQEITKMLELMLSVSDEFLDYQFVIAGAPSQDFELYKPFLNNKNVAFVSNKTYDLLANATAALVTSGTATLETALFKVPEVVCYKGSWLSYQIAKRIITLKYISLVNLIMDKEVVKELIQSQCNKNEIKAALQKILVPENRSAIQESYVILEEKLGGKGASAKTAQLIFDSVMSSLH